MKDATDIVFACEGLSTCPEPEAGSFDLAMRAGECVVFAGVEADSLHHLGDLFLGLIAPARGRVTVLGQDWQTMDPREAEHLRRQTGRVLAAPGRAAWLQNLDVEENVYLARQFEPSESPEGLRQRALALCGAFGLEELPSTRPADTPSDVLMRAQWVRAFLPEPLRLLVLEAPDGGGRSSASGKLREQVRVARASGTVVIWIDLGAATGLDETLRYDGVPAAVSRRF
jgi:ABC-type transporter Mla maintaining outer membrane lipid asymmetry ATPase subunit MlaF